MVGHTFTDALDVDIGDPTRASDYDTLADNTEANRETADVDHDFDITTGSGYHNGAFSDGIRLVNGAGSTSAAVLYLDDNGKLWIKSATGTTTPPTPSDASDGEMLVSGGDTSEGGFDAPI